VIEFGFYQNQYGPADAHKYHKIFVNGSSILGLRAMDQIFVLKQNSPMPKVSSRCKFVGFFRIRPARKPLDLYLNLEDKVQVNPAAMIED
jgi:hypothetical protein